MPRYIVKITHPDRDGVVVDFDEEVSASSEAEAAFIARRLVAEHYSMDPVPLKPEDFEVESVTEVTP